MHTLVRILGAAALLAVLATPAFATATINIINMDGPGEGLNDPAPATPVGGNPGTTIGQQRLLCVQQAANLWGSYLTSPVPINIEVAFNLLAGMGSTPQLGKAMSISSIANDPALEFPGYWYVVALANKQAGVDLDPAQNDITAQFNTDLGGRGWYCGFDQNENPGTQYDLLDEALHEFAHGLGFTTMTSLTTGEYYGSPDNPLPGICDKFLYDETSGLHWDEMLPSQRVASAISTGNLTWDGAAVSYWATKLLSHVPELVVPFGSGILPAAPATFGPEFTTAAMPGILAGAGAVTAQAVWVVDDAGAPGDACTTITNAAALAGKIAVIDKAECGAGSNWASKTKKVQDAGAIGCIWVNNAALPVLVLTGDDKTITIPAIIVTQAGGSALKTAIAGGPTSVTIRWKPTAIMGLAPSGRVRMFAPSPLEPMGNASHFDSLAIPRQLMSPLINVDRSIAGDLTRYYLQDIGWFGPLPASVPGAGAASRVALASHPNPARTSASVHFELPTAETLQLTLYDVSGRQVRVLAKGAFVAGPHDVAWDGLDAAGRRAAPGVYLARLKGPRTQATHHLVLVN